ncbi:MAG TPA: Ni/Fe hydrogenase subunit alpha [Acidimicrobiales bacterium]|nr:Ni/Fe hydrogenase subunit alpha [Acidimicrobiales bacterium]
MGRLARVEGEGGMYVALRDGTVTEVRLEIYEPPRFFEAFLQGRGYTEPPDITARVCGICPIAYQVSACNAIGNACGVETDERVERLRRLVYCGEWIQSHMLHILLLHAPDFLGYESGIALAADHRRIVEQGLALKKVGNDLMALVGGRAIHPVNLRVGGFYRGPGVSDVRAMMDRLCYARDTASEIVQWVAGFDFPDHEVDYVFVGLREPGEYPITRGRLVSSQGLDAPISEFEAHIVEEQVPHSHALHARLRDGGPYLTGPMARYALNFELLPDVARTAALEAGLGPVCRNPFRSIVVRAVEVLYACDEAIRIVGDYEAPDPELPVVPARAGVGRGASEAPRGVLLHRYQLDGEGTILDARIVPPTSQNQATIEADLRKFVEGHADLDDEALGRGCEQVIRNHDPCISCATHFLDLRVDRL